MISFHIPGEPVAKGRARSFIRNGRIGHHTPVKTVNYEALVALYAHQAMHECHGDLNLMDGPLCLSFCATFAIPKSWTKKRLAEHLVRPEPVVKRPDLDNIAKALADGMNGIVYLDDSQIAWISCQKVYGDVPGVSLTVSKVTR